MNLIFYGFTYCFTKSVWVKVILCAKNKKKSVLKIERAVINIIQY